MIAEDLAAFAVTSRDQPLPEDVVHGAKRALLDWYGATVAGSATAAGRSIRAGLDFGAIGGRSRLVPDGARLDPPTAALVNGTASHVVEMDDIYRDGIYHPGSPTIAAALAAAEHLGASGASLLRAIAIGYELSCRVAAAVQPSHYRFWHTTGTVGTLGAAAAVGELLELDTEPLAWALANATTTAAGLQQAFRSDSMGKPLHAGHAASAGLIAAFAARGGFTGAVDILEGDAGFGAGMSDRPDWAAAIAKLGTTWAVTQQTVKNHSCCGHTFAAVDAALELRTAGLDLERVEDIRVETYATALEVAGMTEPATEFEAKFSISYVVAAALQVGSVRLASFTPARLGDPKLRGLARKVRLDASKEFDDAFPGQRCARVTVTLDDGSTRVSTRYTRHGDPDDPLTDVELGDKVHELMEHVIGAERATAVSDALWRIESSKNVDEALSSIGQPGGNE